MILAFPQASASIVYGIYRSLTRPVGREWGLIVNGELGPALLKPAPIISAQAGVLTERERFARSRRTPRLPSCRTRHRVGFGTCGAARRAARRRFQAKKKRGLCAAMNRVRLSLQRVRAPCCWPKRTLLDGPSDDPLGVLRCFEAALPAVTVREQRALVISGRGPALVMAGGGTSWLDLALYLIARWCGVDAAMQVARLSLIDWHEIGQQPFARLARSRQVEDAAIARCQTWIAGAL